MSAAIEEVKRDLGRDAVIVQTRSVPRAGLLGQWRRPLWEVVASPAGSLEGSDLSAADSGLAGSPVPTATEQENAFAEELRRQAARMDQDMARLRLTHGGRFVVYSDGEVLADGSALEEVLSWLSTDPRRKPVVVRFISLCDEAEHMGGPRE
jgi:hypothetical protein